MADSDLSALWKDYLAAVQRKELNKTREQLAAYLLQWVEQGEKTVVPSPEISKEHDRFGLLTAPQA